MDCRAHRDRKCASNAKNLRAKTTTTAHRAPMLAPHRQSETESGAPTRDGGGDQTDWFTFFFRYLADRPFPNVSLKVPEMCP